MKILLHNLNHDQGAHNLLLQTVREWKIDVAILVDPYKAGVTHPWVTDVTGEVAIWPSGNLPFQDIADCSQRGFVRVKLGGIHFYSCYAPPRLDHEPGQFTDLLNRLVDDVKEHYPAVIAGDFNAWAVEWGSKTNNNRGKELLEAMSCLDVGLLNTGSTPTFERNGGTSIIDLTFVSTCLVRQCTNWKVNDIFNLSDHRVITWEIGKTGTPPEKPNALGWKAKKFDPELFRAALETGLISAHNAEEESKIVMRRVVRACDTTMPRKGSDNRHSPVYWWSENIAILRKKCILARRSLTRRRKKKGESWAELQEQLQERYKKARARLVRAIKASKKQCWKELLEEVESDPWGRPYKVVVKRLKGQTTPSPCCPVFLGKVVQALFPQRPSCQFLIEQSAEQVIPPVTREELTNACAKVGNSKAPGPDGIPNVALKEAIEAAPEMFLSMYNRCLQEETFPDKWKQQRLVLLPKGKKPPDEPSSYRPLCMLDTAGKILERIIHGRIEEVSEGHLSKNQFGFRKGRSTLDAIDLVTSIAKEAASGERWKGGKKQYCVIVALDIKNAFNSARWDRIMEALTMMEVPGYLLKMVASYFSGRILKYDTEEGPKEYQVTGGVPQGSVLGPLLWNIMYDGLLRLKLPRAVTPVAFADDIALVIVGKYLEDLRNLFDVCFASYQEYLDYLGLDLAKHKTEAVLVTGRKVVETITLRVGQYNITSQPSIRYLGVMIDARLNYKQQVEHAANKASMVGAALSRLMPNVGGPKQNRRALLASVVTSVITYGIAIWADGLRAQEARRKLTGVYRLSALRVASAYRTVSKEAIEVIAGMMPIEELSEERRRTYRRRKGTQTEADQVKRQERQISLMHWQEAWDRSDKGRWTYRLIPCIDKWVNRAHGSVNYYLTQMLSGHGCFRGYLYKYKYEDSPECPTCSEVNEDAEHVFFHCPRYQTYRAALEQTLGRRITAETLVEAMLTTEVAWMAVTKFATEVTQDLRREERKRTELKKKEERRNPPNAGKDH